MRGIAIATLALLAACAAPEATRRAETPLTLPPMNTFARAVPTPPGRTNAEIARDFLDLSFALENGETLPYLTRFEGPITIRLIGNAPETLSDDLDRLLSRFRSEAGLAVSRIPASQPASITVETVPRGQFRRTAPSAACFVRPDVSTWAEARGRRTSWLTFRDGTTQRTRMAVFLPDDVSPQEARACLHEEIGQALGPVNDLYRLTDSVFNDDDFHSVLTGFDMLVLHAYYDGELRSGMSREEVARRLPGIFARLNPSGGRGGIAPPLAEWPGWQEAIDRANSPGTPRARRIAAARRAAGIAEAEGGPLDPRLAYSNYLLGRLLLSERPEEALAAFLRAGRIYAARPDTAIHEAQTAFHIALFQLSSGRGDAVIRNVDRHIGVVRQSEQAGLLASMLFLKAEALALEGRESEANATRNEALGWARYGFAGTAEIRRRAAEIHAISPGTPERTPT